MVDKKDKQNGGCCYKVFSIEEFEEMVDKAKKKYKNKKNTSSFINKEDLTQNKKVYTIIDNGGTPFKVIANNKGIYIYKLMSYVDKKENEPYEYNEIRYEYTNEPIHTIKNFIGYWYGVDTGPFNKSKSSILVQISKRKYISIGMEIISFSTSDTIIDFSAYLGNNDVPYPMAFSLNKVYLLLEKVEIEKKLLSTEVNLANVIEIYEELYSDRKKKNYNKLKNLKTIEKRNDFNVIFTKKK